VSEVPVFAGRHVEAAVPPDKAVEVVREAFVAYSRGEWLMPPKVYAPAYPAGDFRAMPALGAGHALLKWVTSFPGNPARGLPTVVGLVLVSDAETGLLRAILDAAAVTALRTGAAAVLAAETLGRPGTAAVVGAGVNGRAAARAFIARGHQISLWDVDETRARVAAEELGAEVAPSREDALAASLVATVTPGREILFPHDSLRPGQHVSLMGADGPGKAEIAPEELARVRVFCDDWEQAGTNRTRDPEARVRVFVDDWEQASHGGDVAGAAEAGLLSRADVTQLGEVLAGTALGRRSPDDITIFDSTGLAIQDLAIALAAIERADELNLPTLEL
jgi:ornithine cyclodeaminase/alanine dehydrogenase-like protein (mu-crystallin family)